MESNSLSDYSGCGAADLSLSSTDGKDSAMQALPGTLQAENVRLRGSVTSLETALHRTIDCLKLATSEAARQKRQSGMRVSDVAARLFNQYAGYETGKVIYIYRWDVEKRRRDEEAARVEAHRIHCDTVRQAAQHRQEERLRAAGLEDLLLALRNTSARSRLM